MSQFKAKLSPPCLSAVLWRCLSTLLIFLHLLEETSLLVLLPVGLGACVEVFGIISLLQQKVSNKDQAETNEADLSSRQVWKVFKVFNIQWLSKSSKVHVSMVPFSRLLTVVLTFYIKYIYSPLTGCSLICILAAFWLFF